MSRHWGTTPGMRRGRHDGPDLPPLFTAQTLLRVVKVVPLLLQSCGFMTPRAQASSQGGVSFTLLENINSCNSTPPCLPQSDHGPPSANSLSVKYNWWMDGWLAAD